MDDNINECHCVCMCVSLESRTVEPHCSEGGIGDVAAARHTEDL